MTAAIDDPLAPASGQFPLAAPGGTPASDETPSPIGLRPWGLRSLTDASNATAEPMPTHYDHDQQVRVDENGEPLVWMGDPTAKKTSSVDGEDGPSSVDWINDFYPDEPYQT